MSKRRLPRGDPSPKRARRAASSSEAAEAGALLDTLDQLAWAELVEEHGAALVEEYRRFLALKALDGDASLRTLRHSPSGRVDAVWHSHMLRPQLYVAACRAVLGEGAGVLQHSPATARRADRAQRLAHTVARYEEVFGHAAPDEWWSEEAAAPAAAAAAAPAAPRARLQLVPLKRSLRSNRRIVFDVVTQLGQRYRLDMSSASTIATVRKKMEGLTGIPPKDQRLLFMGERLGYYPTLADSPMEDGDTVDLVRALAGC